MLKFLSGEALGHFEGREGVRVANLVLTVVICPIMFVCVCKLLVFWIILIKMDGISKRHFSPHFGPFPGY